MHLGTPGFALTASDSADEASEHTPLRDLGQTLIIQEMKANIDVDGDLFKKAQRAAGKTSKAQVVELALRAFIEQEARKRLAALEGSIPKAKAGRRQRVRRGAA